MEEVVDSPTACPFTDDDAPYEHVKVVEARERTRRLFGPVFRGCLFR